MSRLTRRQQGLALITLSAICFGFLPIFGAIAYRAGADAQAILLLRFGLAGSFMFLVMLTGKIRWPRGRLLAGLVAMGGLGYVGQAFCYFSALQYASAALAALLLYLYPIMVTLLSALLFKEQISRRGWLALVVASAGLLLTLGDTGTGQWLGVAFGIGAAAIYSVYILAGAKLSPQAGALPSASVVMLSGFASMAGSTVFHTPLWPQSSIGWAAIVAIALISTVIAIFAFLAGLDRLSAAEASTLSTLEPVISVILAASLLSDPISTTQWLGGFAIIAAALLIALQPAQPIPE